MALAALALCAPLLSTGSPVLPTPLPWPLFIAIWLPFELVVLHLQYGNDPDNADTFVLSEIPLALGLLLTPSPVLIAVGVLTPTLVDLVRHNKSTTKQVFNAVNKAIEIGVAITVYRVLQPNDPLSLSGWAALCLAVAASSATTSLLVSLVISLASDRMPLRDFLLHTALAMPMAFVGATVALCSALVLQDGLALALPLAALLVAMLLLLQGFTVMTERHVSLIRLHAMSQRLSSAPDVDSVVHAALDACTDLVDGRQTTVYFPDPRSDAVVRGSEGADGRAHVVRVGQDEQPAERGILQRRTALVAAASSRSGREVVLSVVGRRAPVRPFRPEDLRVLEMAAHQTAHAMQTAQLIDRLRHDALHDALTDLPNRRSTLTSLAGMIAAGRTLCVVRVGLLDLEKVNTALGHDHGETLLVEVARRLSAACDTAAIVSRVADDGFALVVAGHPSPQDPLQTVATALAALARPFLVGGAAVHLRACAGVAQTPGDSGLTGAELLRRADIAMRHARATGVEIEVYAVEHETETVAELSLAAELRSGIARDELVLHAQPQTRFADGRVTGMEMLVRWKHPTRGLLYPQVFLPVAEQTGLEKDLTAWVLEAAIKAVAEWRQSGVRVTVSVNVSARSLTGRDLGELMERLLVAHRVPGDQLVVEITETELFTNIEAAAGVLRALTDLGVKVSIDDFGTGFSSLSRLRHLPVSEIKIDRSFVTTMLQNKDDEAIVRSIIELARSLDLVCVAEGIEDSDVYTTLRGLGCGLGQGYHIARPMPLDAVVEWVAEASLEDCPGRPGLHPDVSRGA